MQLKTHCAFSVYRQLKTIKGCVNGAIGSCIGSRKSTTEATFNGLLAKVGDNCCKKTKVLGCLEAIATSEVAYRISNDKAAMCRSVRFKTTHVVVI